MTGAREGAVEGSKAFVKSLKSRIVKTSGTSRGTDTEIGA
jgi:hypothetical protein